MNLNELAHVFDAPLAEHRACPFWFWNGDMEPAEMRRQVRLMSEMGLGGFVIHARVGLTVPYLSEAWFDRCGIALEEAERLGMKVWLYDEDNWPSGYAGGRVIAEDPSRAGQHLAAERHYTRGGGSVQVTIDRPHEVRVACAVRIASVQPVPPDPLRSDYRAVEAPWYDGQVNTLVYAAEAPVPIAIDGDQLRWTPPDGDWCVMVLRQRATDFNAAYSDRPYVDLMNPQAVESFIAHTHEQYRLRFARHFGKTVLGFFVDEPGFYNNFLDRAPASLPWTHDFATEFAARRGYDLLPWVAALWEDLGDRGRQVRVDYWQTVAELLEARFYGRLAAWCADHGMALTGHLLLEEWMTTLVRHTADPFAALRPLQVPAVDKIDEVDEKISEKLVASIAHANDRPRVLSETFACIGWKLAPPYMRQIVDRQYVRGVNWLSCHGFYYSTEDWRKRECPPSEFFQNPWWPHSRPLWDYVGRLSAALSAGRHAAPVALYYPTEHAWAALSAGAPKPYPDLPSYWPWPMSAAGPHPAYATDLAMQQIARALTAGQYDYDFVDHGVVVQGTVGGAQLRTATESFRAVVVPPVDAIDAAVVRQLAAFASGGGLVVFAHKVPIAVVACGAGSTTDLPADWTTALAAAKQLKRAGTIAVGRGHIGFVPAGEAGVLALLRQHVPPDVRVVPSPQARQIRTVDRDRGYFKETRLTPRAAALTYHRRRLDDGDAYLLVNESDADLDVEVELAGGPAAAHWDAASGQRVALRTSAATTPGTSRIAMRFGPQESKLIVLGPASELSATAEADAEADELEHSVTPDGWSVELDGRTIELGADLRTWDELGDGQFSGIATYRARLSVPPAAEATHRWTINLGQVFETASLTINGVRLPPRCWGPYRWDVTGALRAGENAVVVEVANTNLNAFVGTERPSGLLGPVQVQGWRR
jgi:hypothetical protein